jgi:Leucine-rich repeat (LRR) protein
LQTLGLSYCRIDDDWLSEAAKLPNLKHLALKSNKLVTTRGVTHLTASRTLEELMLPLTGIDNAALGAISKLQQLKALYVGGTNIDDKGIEQLAPLRNLKILYLPGTGVSDESIPTLCGLKSLEVVSIDDTRITQNGRSRLRKSHLRVDDLD